MKHLKNRILRLSIRKKLIFYSYLVITPVLLCISVLLFLHNYNSALRQEEESCMQAVLNVSGSIGVLQSNIMEMGTYICINKDITNILTDNAPQVLNRNAKLWEDYAPLEIIQDMVAIDGQIKTLAIYPENGVNPYLSCVDRSAYILDMEQVREQEIYALAVQEKGKFLWQRLDQRPQDTYQLNHYDKIVMYREIYNLARNKKLGFLVIGSKAEPFDEICQNALRNKEESIVVLSEYGVELVRCGNVEDDTVSEMVQEKSREDFGKELVKSSTWKGYQIYQCRNEDTGTIVYKMVPKVGMLDFVDTIIYTPMALLTAFLVGMYPVLILISNIISKPLHTLSIAMEKFKQGDFSQKVEVMTYDEVGEASACFNRMVDDIRELIDKNYVMAIRERESELDVLQAQINPHFLYNTLDSLYWKAIESDNEEMGEDIFSLSQLFRLVLSRGNGIVMVRTEAELLERYLHIQKMRFGKRLEYEIVIEEQILEEEIPKLILQPFVENAIVHGFEKVEEDFFLSITGEKRESHMVFRIRDTGVGMSREQLETIWEKKEDRQYASQRIGRYAIKNVRERLELLYHEDFQLVIESKKGEGTEVTISIPLGLKELRTHEHKTTDSG